MRHAFLLLTVILTFNYAATLKDVVISTVTNNPELISLEKNTQAQSYYIDEARGDFFPSLKLDAFISEITTDTKNGSSSTVNTDKNGHNIKLKLDQLIYDGGSREAKYSQMKDKYDSKKLENLSLVSSIVLTTTNSYLDAVRYEESMLLTKYNILVHEKYLQTAIDAKEVSGESLDMIQVESKLLTTKVQFYNDLETQIDNIIVLNDYSNIRVDNKICRPKIDINFIPSTFDKYKEKVLLENHQIQKEILEIKIQKNVLSQEVAKFLPTIKASFSKELDDGADVKDVRTNETEAKITLSYNIFNGLKDRANYKKEALYLKESQKRLDSVVNSVLKDVESTYFKYKNAKRKISDLKKYIINNKEILKIYKEQFEGGSKTFMDILNQEAELYRAKNELIDEEFLFLKNYYSLVNYISMLNSSILDYKDSSCETIVVDLETQKEKDDTNLEKLLEEDLAVLTKEKKLTKEKTANIKIENKNNEKIDAMLAGILTDIYGTKETFNENNKNEIFYSNSNNLTSSLQEEFSKETSIFFTIYIPNFKSSSVNGTKGYAKKYKLEENILVYKDKNKKLNLLFGTYETKADAKKALKTLDQYIKAKKPEVNSLKLHIDIYKEGK